MAGNVNMFRAAALMGVVLVWTGTFAASQAATPADGQRSPDASGEDRTVEDMHGALGWLDRYMTVQVLFDQKDIEALRAKVAEMSPDELQDWIEKTKDVRAKLDSEPWQETRQWLEDFLRVQAMYSEEELAQFRAKSAEMSPVELYGLMDRIEQKRKSLRWMHEASERSRQATLAWGEKYQRRQEARRRAALSAGYWRGDRPFFGTDQVYGYPRYRGYRESRGYLPPPPLITSREVARWAVYQSIFGRGGVFW